MCLSMIGVIGVEEGKVRRRINKRPSCPRLAFSSGRSLTMGLLLLIIVLVLLLGGLPHWGYHSYGYGPSGIGTVLLIIVIVLLLTGRL